MTAEPREVLRPSLLVRLLGGEAAEVRAHWDLDRTATDLRREVCAHLEQLFNARRSERLPLEGLPEAAASYLTYGMPDLSGHSPSNPADLQQVCTSVRALIRRFEPRLDPNSVRVVPHSSWDRLLFLVRFRVEATLWVEPVREDVAFDTEVSLPECSIRVTLEGS